MATFIIDQDTPLFRGGGFGPWYGFNLYDAMIYGEWRKYTPTSVMPFFDMSKPVTVDFLRGVIQRVIDSPIYTGRASLVIFDTCFRAVDDVVYRDTSYDGDTIVLEALIFAFENGFLGDNNIVGFGSQKPLPHPELEGKYHHPEVCFFSKETAGDSLRFVESEELTEERKSYCATTRLNRQAAQNKKKRKSPMDPGASTGEGGKDIFPESPLSSTKRILTF